MAQKSYQVGDMVVLSTSEWQGQSAVVCAPAKPGKDGHVLVLSDGFIQGVSVSVEDITLADEDALGFAQLASNLIKLGSHVIEKRIIRLI
jgi:hypothetical protein